MAILKKKFLILAPFLSSENKENTSPEKENIRKKSEEKKADFSTENKQEVLVEKVKQPLNSNRTPSLFSIKANLEKEESIEKEEVKIEDDNRPSHHFTETDLDKEWKKFLQEISLQNSVTYNAVNAFQLKKKDENTVEIFYSSESAKSEFEKIQHDFFNHFKHKVNHFKIEIIYTLEASLKKEILTKRKIFDKFAEINPLLKELDDLMKFDFN